MPGREYTAQSVAGYRFGFNTQEKDDEIYGKGNATSAEYWEYDSRLGRRWNVDPLESKFPWQSPYVCFNDNPISKVDPKGLEAESTDKPSHAEKKFNRKYEKWKSNNLNVISGLNNHEIYERFKSSKNWFGKTRGDTKWFNAYEKNNNTSQNTGWKVKVDVPDPQIITPPNGTANGIYIQTTDIGTSAGTLTVNYGMAGEPDRLQIINPADGSIIFDTRVAVTDNDGSGQTVTFNLGTGNTLLQISVNADATPPVNSVFTFKIIVNPITLKKMEVKETKPRKR